MKYSVLSIPATNSRSSPRLRRGDQERMTREENRIDTVHNRQNPAGGRKRAPNGGGLLYRRRQDPPRGKEEQTQHQNEVAKQQRNDRTRYNGKRRGGPDGWQPAGDNSKGGYSTPLELCIAFVPVRPRGCRRYPPLRQRLLRFLCTPSARATTSPPYQNKRRGGGAGGDDAQARRALPA